MNEYGITRYCVCCNKPFFCTDGDYFCSSKCEDEWEKANHEDQEIEDDD